MEERRLKSRRPRSPQAAAELAVVLGGSRRTGARRVDPQLLAAITGCIESLAATAEPVVEASDDALRGDDPVRQRERLVVALKNLEAAMSAATLTVRTALEDIERPRPRVRHHK